MIGHSDRIIPKVVQRTNPVTVRQYILAEIASVSPVRMTFRTCGTKLLTEQTEARYPTMRGVSKPVFLLTETFTTTGNYNSWPLFPNARGALRHPWITACTFFFERWPNGE